MNRETCSLYNEPKIYKTIRKDQTARPGGRVAILIRARYWYQEIQIAAGDEFEAVGIESNITGINTKFISIYQQPNRVTDSTTFRRLLTPRTLIGGDLNAKHTAWGCRSTNVAGKQILQAIQQTTGADVWGPQQSTSRPPRGRGKIIDIFLGTKITTPTDVTTHMALDWTCHCSMGNNNTNFTTTNKNRLEPFYSTL